MQVKTGRLECFLIFLANKVINAPFAENPSFVLPKSYVAPYSDLHVNYFNVHLSYLKVWEHRQNFHWCNIGLCWMTENLEQRKKMLYDKICKQELQCTIWHATYRSLSCIKGAFNGSNLAFTILWQLKWTTYNLINSVNILSTAINDLETMGKRYLTCTHTL